MSVLCQPGNAFRFRFVQNQQHEDVIGDIPFARNSTFTSRSKSESRIVVRVSHNNNKWATCVLEFPIPRFDQFTSYSLALAFRKYRHRTQCGTFNVAANRYGTVHDVTHHSIVQCRN